MLQLFLLHWVNFYILKFECLRFTILQYKGFAISLPRHFEDDFSFEDDTEVDDSTYVDFSEYYKIFSYGKGNHGCMICYQFAIQLTFMKEAHISKVTQN